MSLDNPGLSNDAVPENRVVTSDNGFLASLDSGFRDLSLSLERARAGNNDDEPLAYESPADNVTVDPNSKIDFNKNQDFYKRLMGGDAQLALGLYSGMSNGQGDRLTEQSKEQALREIERAACLSQYGISFNVTDAHAQSLDSQTVMRKNGHA